MDTGIVHVVSLQVDKNHDGEMDLRFNGQDATSLDTPMVCWVNGGYIKPGSNGNLDQEEPLPNNDPAYANSAYGKITCQRDLENFFRLWVCGVPTLAFSNGYSATLTYNPLSGSPAINVYEAETNGGTLYLTDTNAAQSLINQQTLGNVGTTTSGSGTLIFPHDFFN